MSKVTIFSSYHNYHNRLLCFIISGWSFIIGIIGAIACVVTSVLFLTEATVQEKKLNQLKDSQARFELERETKA